MLRSALVAALVALAVVPASGFADHAMPGSEASVSIGFDGYAPPHVDVLAGDSVGWSDDSSRGHTVTADDGSWDSGRLTGGDHYAHRFDAAGQFGYYCRLHAGMVGEVDVHELLLDPQAEGAAPGQTLALGGRAALPLGSLVTIEADDGSGYAPVTTARVDSSGMFSADVRVGSSTSYRAAAPDGQTSPPVLVVVHDRHVTTSAARHGRDVAIGVKVTPADRGGTVVLQLRLRERFGWWPVRQAKLGRSSRARFVLHDPNALRARVLLTRSDGATPLGRGPVFRIARAR
jgi:plastocyanin